MKILLFTNTASSLTPQTLRSICGWLEEQDITYDVFSSEFIEKQSASVDRLCASITDYDLICSFGGDGTTLRAAHIVGKTGVPLLSYNFGRLGFLSGACKDDLIPAMQAAIDGKLNFDARSMLELRVAYEHGRIDQQIVVNELAVTRGHFGRIVELDLSINGSLVTTVRGDGILVATPTGSTGYALSAGGPIISPNNESICVVPISPHSLTSRAVVTAKDDVILIVPNEQNRQKLALFIDGEVFWVAGDSQVLAAAGEGPATGQGAAGAGNSDSPGPQAAAPDGDGDGDGGSQAAPGDDGGDGGDGPSEILWIEARVCPEKLLLARYGPYDFYDHISQTFFRGRNA